LYTIQLVLPIMQEGHAHQQQTRQRQSAGSHTTSDNESEYSRAQIPEDGKDDEVEDSAISGTVDLWMMMPFGEKHI